MMRAPARQAAHWSETLENLAHHVEFGASDPARLEGSATLTAFPHLSFLELHVPQPIAMRHWVSGAAMRSCDEIFLILPRSGSIRFLDGVREETISPHAAVIVSTRHRYMFRQSENLDALSVRIPGQRLRNLIPWIDELGARPMMIDNVFVPFVVSAIEQMLLVSGHLDEDEKLRLEDQLLALIVLMLNRASAHGPPIGTARQMRYFDRIDACIDRNLGNPDLGAALLAAQLGVSVRQLHYLMKMRGESLGQRIRARRLDNCRRALRNPITARLPISEIALRWGFRSAAHFSRIFKAHYGMLPSHYRQQRIP